MYVVASNFHGITAFFRNAKLYKYLSDIYFRIVPFCNCELLLPTIMVLEIFLEAILWAPFQLNRRILNYVICTKQRRPFNADFPLGKGKNQLGLGWEHGICSSVVTLFFAKKSLTKTDRCAGALSWRGDQLFIFHFSGRFLQIVSIKWRGVSMYISLFTF